MKWLDNCLLTLAIIGCIVWGLIGFFQFNLVSFLFGDGTWLTRIIYALVGLSGLYIISFYGRLDANKVPLNCDQRYFYLRRLFAGYLIYFFFDSLFDQRRNLMRLHVFVFFVINRIKIIYIRRNRTKMKTVKNLIRID